MDPVSFLDSFCRGNGFSLEFTGISEKVDNLFACRCEMENMTALGRATSKKRAKQIAARVILCELIDKQMFQYSDLNRANDVLEADLAKEHKPAQKSVEHDDSDKQCVSELFHICTHKNWSPPAYDCQQIGKSYKEMFMFKCSIADIDMTTVGQGTSKKMAKRNSAKAMLEYFHKYCVQSCPPNDSGHALHKLIQETTNKQLLYKKSLASQQVNKIYEDLSKNVDIISYLKKVKKRCSITDDSLELCANKLIQLDASELSIIVERLADIGQFEVKTTFAEEEVNVCTVTLIKNGSIFFAWYGRSTDQNEASKWALAFTIKSFIDEMFVSRS